jgi:translation elongation factor P/translation initiation factor 5A
MRKKASELKKDELIIVGDKSCKVLNIEVSDIGKQGTKKVRLEVLTENGEKIILLRPQDYPFDVKK